jgi:hypothetical protein
MESATNVDIPMTALLNLARSGFRLVKNRTSRMFARADYRRWSSPTGLEEWWDERTRVVATLVPASSRVIEFGAGRRQLEKYLPPDCDYVPSDLTDRGSGTIVCDLNKRPLPDLQRFAPTVAVFSGVLEYIKDVDHLVSWLVDNGVETFVVSFDAMPASGGLRHRWSELCRRTSNGYMNNLTEQGLKAIFAHAGLRCAERRQWTTQGIYRFIKDAG